MKHIKFFGELNQVSENDYHIILRIKTNGEPETPPDNGEKEPTEFTPIAHFNFRDSERPYKDSENGAELELHHYTYPGNVKVVDSEEAINGKACLLRISKPHSDYYKRLTREDVKHILKSTRSELLLKELPEEYTSMHRRYLKKNTPYVFQWGSRITELYDRDTEPKDYHDAGCSIIGLKQDYYPKKGSNVMLDGMARFRIYEEALRITVDAHKEGGEKVEEKIAIPEFFDHHFHVWQLETESRSDEKGYFRLFLDNELIWEYEGITAFNQPWGNYVKFGLYDNLWKAYKSIPEFRDTGSELKELEIDFFIIGVPV